MKLMTLSSDQLSNRKRLFFSCGVGAFLFIAVYSYLFVQVNIIEFPSLLFGHIRLFLILSMLFTSTTAIALLEWLSGKNLHFIFGSLALFSLMGIVIGSIYPLSIWGTRIPPVPIFASLLCISVALWLMINRKQKT